MGNNVQWRSHSYWSIGNQEFEIDNPELDDAFCLDCEDDVDVLTMIMKTEEIK